MLLSSKHLRSKSSHLNITIGNFLKKNQLLARMTSSFPPRSLSHHSEPHRALRTIYVLDRDFSVLQQHEIDESGKLKNPCSAGVRKMPTRSFFPIPERQSPEASLPPLPMIGGRYASHASDHAQDPLTAPTFATNLIYSSRIAIQTDLDEWAVGDAMR
jgi:hypothetical protein